MNATSSNISKEGNSGREEKKDQNTYTGKYAKKRSSCKFILKKYMVEGS